jgi:O-antigen/teichoic acid export membrane protein
VAVTRPAAAWFKAPDLAWLLPLFALSLPFAALGTISVSSLQALRRMGALTVIQYLLDPGLRIVALIGLALLGWGLFAAAASHLLASVVVPVVACFCLSSLPLFARPLRARFAPGPLLAFSLPLLLSSVVAFLLQWADTLLLGYYLTAREVGFYGAASRLAGLGAIFLTAVSTIFAPKIYALYGQGELAEVGRLYQRSTRWILMLVVPLVLYTVLNAEALLAMFGPEFVRGASALLTLAAAVLVMTGTGPAGDVVLMSGRTRAVLYTSAATGILGLGLNVWLIPRWGLLGAASATGLAMASGNLANVILAWWFTGLQPYSRAIAKPILLAAGVAGLQLALGPLVGESPLGRLVAGAGIWLLYPVLLRRLGLLFEDLEVWRVVRGSKACVGSSASSI